MVFTGYSNAAVALVKQGEKGREEKEVRMKTAKGKRGHGKRRKNVDAGEGEEEVSGAKELEERGNVVLDSDSESAKGLRVLSSDKTYAEANMIRLHPTSRGVEMTRKGHKFIGVSCDVFTTLDTTDAAEIWIVTRKVNMTIQVSSRKVSPMNLFRKLVNADADQALSQADAKCTYHGNKKSGLKLNRRYESLMKNFRVQTRSGTFEYEYDSVGIAAEDGFKKINHRGTNHIEIKFRRQGNAPMPPAGDWLVLNLHLSACKDNDFGEADALNRFKTCVGLFYQIVRQGRSGILDAALRIDLQNFEALQYGVSCPTDIGKGAAGLSDEGKNVYVLALNKYRKALVEREHARLLTAHLNGE